MWFLRRPPEVGVVLHDWLQVLLYVRLVLLRDDVTQVVSDGVEPLVSRLLRQKNVTMCNVWRHSQTQN